MFEQITQCVGNVAHCLIHTNSKKYQCSKMRQFTSNADKWLSHKRTAVCASHLKDQRTKGLISSPSTDQAEFHPFDISHQFSPIFQVRLEFSKAVRVRRSRRTAHTAELQATDIVSSRPEFQERTASLRMTLHRPRRRRLSEQLRCCTEQVKSSVTVLPVQSGPETDTKEAPCEAERLC
jgi:hypothetical protein